MLYNSALLTATYHRNTAAAGGAAITLVTMTCGTWASGGFKEMDATLMPGWYQLGMPDAALATGADSVSLHIRGVVGSADAVMAIDLIDPPATAAALASAVALLATTAQLNTAVATLQGNVITAAASKPTDAPGTRGSGWWRDTK